MYVSHTEIASLVAAVAGGDLDAVRAAVAPLAERAEKEAREAAEQRALREADEAEIVARRTRAAAMFAGPRRGEKLAPRVYRLVTDDPQGRWIAAYLDKREHQSVLPWGVSCDGPSIVLFDASGRYRVSHYGRQEGQGFMASLFAEAERAAASRHDPPGGSIRKIARLAALVEELGL